MITGFLFFSKLIDGRIKCIDWGKLFIGRFLRLVPLYLFFMFLVFLLVAYLSNGILNEPIPKLIKDAIHWLGFTILGTPSLNGIGGTTLSSIAGITWSLPYEWFFYFSLPLLALTVRVRPPIAYIALGVASIVGLAIWHPQIHHLISFFGGITTAFLARSQLFRRFAVKKVASFLSLGCVGITVVAFPSAYSIVPLFLLSVAFALIASGNSLFGALVSPVSRNLGESAYSIYLLHSITLFVTFTFILGVPKSRTLSPISHWFIVMGITPILIFICFLTYLLIERPAMQSTTRVTAWLRSFLSLRSNNPAANDRHAN